MKVDGKTVTYTLNKPLDQLMGADVEVDGKTYTLSGESFKWVAGLLSNATEKVALFKNVTELTITRDGYTVSISGEKGSDTKKVTFKAEGQEDKVVTVTVDGANRTVKTVATNSSYELTASSDNKTLTIKTLSGKEADQRIKITVK